jgi:glycosyltransferase involved in cell wall biosynthesis
MGWNVVPFSMHHEKNFSSPWSDYFIENLDRASDYSFTQKLVRVPKFIYSFEARRRLSQLIDEVRPDIAHAHNIYHHISPSILQLLRARSIPTVLTLHDLKLACPAYSMLAPDGICERCRGGKLYNVVTHRCVGGSTTMSVIVLLETLLHRMLGSYRRYVDCFTVPSHFFIQKFCEWGMPASLFRYVPNCLDASRYEPRYTPGEGFLYFGRVARQKGLGTLIRAAAQVKCPLLIAGTGPDLEELRALASQLGSDTRFLGHLSGEALHEAIRSARATVLPSESYENAPISILEAYALGKPVVASRLGGIPELVRENETGICFASGNVTSLAAALRQMLAKTPAQLGEMGRAGRRWVEQDFALQRYRQDILQIYRELGVSTGAPTGLSQHSSS